MRETTFWLTPAQEKRFAHNYIPHPGTLLLDEAVVGRRLTQQAYDAAVARRYLWHEFGDRPAVGSVTTGTR